MSGGRRHAKHAGARPLDGGVNRLLKNASSRWEMTKNDDHKIRNAVNSFDADFFGSRFRVLKDRISTAC